MTEQKPEKVAGRINRTELIQVRYRNSRWRNRIGGEGASFLQPGFFDARRKEIRGITETQVQKELKEKLESLGYKFKPHSKIKFS